MKNMLKLAAISLAFWLTGCATIISGSRQEVLINSNPKKALVSINEIEMGYTPVQKNLKRNQAKGPLNNKVLLLISIHQLYYTRHLVQN